MVVTGRRLILLQQSMRKWAQFPKIISFFGTESFSFWNFLLCYGLYFIVVRVYYSVAAIYDCYKSAVICPDNQASFLYPWVVSCKSSTCTMNLQRDIRATLTAQLTVSVVNNRLFGVSTITMWGVFLWLLIWGYRLEVITISNDKVELDILDG